MDPAGPFPASALRSPVAGLDTIPLPADRHPVAVYLAAHAPNSRHALRHALKLAARLFTGSRFTADVLPWHELRYQQGLGLVVIDTPPALVDIIAAAIAVADLVVIPCRPSPHDLRTVGVVVEMARKARKPFVFVINAATVRSCLAQEAVEVLSTTAPVLKTIIHQRQLFASSMIDGRTAGELDPRSTAAEEITALWQDITAHIRKYGKE